MQYALFPIHSFGQFITGIHGNGKYFFRHEIFYCNHESVYLLSGKGLQLLNYSMITFIKIKIKILTFFFIIMSHDYVAKKC